MRLAVTTSNARVALGLLALTLAASSAGGSLPGVASAAEPPRFGIVPGSFEGGTCAPVKKAEAETLREELEAQCTYKAIEQEAAESKPTTAYTQAAGHPPYGLTGFEFTYTEREEEYEPGKTRMVKVPAGLVKRIRVDLPPGTSFNPETTAKCSMSQVAAGTCPSNTLVGTQLVTTYISGLGDLQLEIQIYNLEPAEGSPLREGLVIPLLNEVVLIEGHVSWHHEPEVHGITTGDFHEFFEIPEVSKRASLVKSVFANVGNSILGFGSSHASRQLGRGLITLPSACSSSTTFRVWAESWEGQQAEALTHTPVGVSGCANVPFAPSVEVLPGAGETQSDATDGPTIRLSVPQGGKATEVGTSDLQGTTVALPEGMTLNAASGGGLEGCTPAQAAIGESEAVACPGRSRIGSVTIAVPQLPVPLTGSAYLGEPASGPITGPPYTLYLVAEAPRYGIAVRLAGEVAPNPETGRLQATFSNNPQLPFTQLTLTLDSGALAPLANPLRCGPASSAASLAPYTQNPASLAPTIEPFPILCPISPPPFAAPGLTQSASGQPSSAGHTTSFTYDIARAEGQRYLTGLRTVLPAGLIGLVPDVSQCAEAQAIAGACGSDSEVGTVAVTAGSGPRPFAFTGTAYLTGKLDGAPYGLSIVVPALAGPFDLGTIVTLATVQIDPHTAKVTVTPVESELARPGGGAPVALRSPLPTIVGGIPVRIRSITVTISRQGFMRNPTGCGALSIESALSGVEALPSTGPATAALTSPFAAEGCAALPFKPSFTASTRARTSRLHGASLEVAISQQPGEAGIASVKTTLPLQLPSRNSTLRKACLQATFEANPLSCPKGSLVGHATVLTPALPSAMSGPAYIVSHGGQAFPDLDLVLSGSGVTIVLVGNTNIKRGITTTTFAANPDVPIERFSLDLPRASNSLLGANGSLCKPRLRMPLTMTGQNGKTVKRTVRIQVSGCLPVSGHRARGRGIRLTVGAPAAGRIRVSGKGLAARAREVRRARYVTIDVPLSAAGRAALRYIRRHRRRERMTVRVRVAFTPRDRHEAAYTSFATVTFPR